MFWDLKLYIYDKERCNVIQYKETKKLYIFSITVIILKVFY